MSTIFDRMRQSFPDQDYRHTYANGLVDSKLATQLKVLREQREWTQARLAEKCGMQQARISVLEDVNYSSWSISTLRRIGKAFDLWLDVEWKEFGELPKTLQNLSREALERNSFDDDPVFHEGVEASRQIRATIEAIHIVAVDSDRDATNTNAQLALGKNTSAHKDRGTNLRQIEIKGNIELITFSLNSPQRKIPYGGEPVGTAVRRVA